MPRLLHKALIKPGEACFDHPFDKDSRWKEFLGILRSYGLIDASGKALKPYTVKRGADATHYLWHVEWNDEQPSLEKLKLLHGRKTESLNPLERQVIEYFVQNGRKLGVAIKLSDIVLVHQMSQ